MPDDPAGEMSKGQLIEFRVRRKLCIRCGHYPALAAPYLCLICQREIDQQKKGETK